MGVIADFLSLIGEALIGIIDFIVSFVMDLVYIVQFIGYILIQIPSFFAWLPPTLSVLLVLGVSAAAIMRIAGR